MNYLNQSTNQTGRPMPGPFPTPPPKPRKSALGTRLRGHRDINSTYFIWIKKINLNLQSCETSNLSADNFNKILVLLNGWTPEPAIRSGNTAQQIPCFDSCLLITTLMCKSVFSWALWASKHWYTCGANGRSGIRAPDYQNFPDA